MRITSRRQLATERGVTESREAMRVHLRVVDPDLDERRPRTRGECVDGPRPCPWLGCRYHLALEVRDNGHLKHLFAEDEAPQTCALDIADNGGATLDEVGIALNMTRERARQLENIAVEAFRKAFVRV